MSILFVNLANLNEVTQDKPHLEVMNMMAWLHKAYDDLLCLYDVSPMHLVGPSIMLCSGVSPENPIHASEVGQVRMNSYSLEINR